MEKEMEDGGKYKRTSTAIHHICFFFKRNAARPLYQHGEEGTRITMIKHGFASFPSFFFL